MNPSLPQTLPQVIRLAAQTHPMRRAIVDGAVVISYADLADKAERVARGLLALGVQAGDRVAIWAPNQFEWILAACGIHMAGAVLVPLNTRMKGAEAADILARSQASLLFCVGDFLGQYMPAQLDGQRPATLQHLVVLGAGQTRSGETPWEEFLQQGDSVPSQAVHEREAALSYDSLADLMFTSGTTGHPKGVMAAHGPTIQAFSVWSACVGLGAGDHYLIVNPFFHTFGYKAGWVAAFLSGATVFPQQLFDAGQMLQRIATDRISFLPGPPTLFLTMLAHPQLQDFESPQLVALKAHFGDHQRP